MRTAVSAALDYGLAAIELGEERAPPVPTALLVQAHLAARSEVSLDTVLRRYFAGYAVLSDFIMLGADDSDPSVVDIVHRISRSQAVVFDRLLVTVAEEYARESEVRRDSLEERRAERVRRLLAGELLDTSEFGYEFDRWHLGALAAGPGAVEALRRFATALDRQLLFARDGDGDGVVWAWIGGRSRPTVEQELAFAADAPAAMTVAFGEPAQGLAGWRLTHRQARAAMPVALRSSRRFVRYADIPLLASMLQDDLLVTSLRQLFLAPLTTERDGGEVLRQTLRAYLTASRNLSSAAAILGVNRRTVTNRIRAVEECIGRSLDDCGAEFQLALQFDELA